MKNFTYLFLLSIIVFGLNACKKKGCTDIDAANYNAEAKKMMGHVYTLRSLH